jgi:hypothetical protein
MKGGQKEKKQQPWYEERKGCGFDRFLCSKETELFDVRRFQRFLTYHGSMTITSSSNLISKDLFMLVLRQV